MEINKKNRAPEIAMVFFLATEVFFFAGLISAYWILRAQISPWPPVNQPRLPVMMTGINTLILIASGVAILQTKRALHKGCNFCVVGWLGLAALGGLIFLLVQGFEWIRLIHFGMTTVANIYGGTFYIVVGAHAAHMLAAMIFLTVIFFKAVQGRYTENRNTELTLCRMYWIFVVAVWPVIYGLVYF
ncbi:MAG: heme-copper oxidase subunit III [Deltaproteobacteria bacterium]|nr:heme-copper oxidase subunit III [Deltaproteobacteria bacterium]